MDLHSKIKINGKRSLVKFMNYQNIDDTLHFLCCLRIFYFTAYWLPQLFCIYVKIMSDMIFNWNATDQVHVF